MLDRCLASVILLLAGMLTGQAAQAACPGLLDHTVSTLLDNKPVNLCEAYRGKVLLIVNTASKCAFTDQYEGLEALYARHKNDGLVVLGFPSNDFANQEPGTEKQIRNFCRMTYGVQFPMFSKTRVTRQNPDPLYASLAAAAGEYPRWNFHKYLITRQGQLAGSYASHVTPQDRQLLDKIQQLLRQDD